MSSPSRRLFLLFGLLVSALVARPSQGGKARYAGNWRLNVFRGSRKTGVLSDAFDSLFVSANDCDSTTSALCGICYMADGRHFLRVELSAQNAGAVYTTREMASWKDTANVVATVTSDEGYAYAIENYSSFDVEKLSFQELFNFELRNSSSGYITSHGSFVN